MAHERGVSTLHGSGLAHVIVDDISVAELSLDDQHHLGVVRRLRDGDSITIGDGRGRWRVATLRKPGKGASRREVHIEFAGEILLSQKLEPPIVIGFCLPSLDRASWALQKMTELGVDEVHLLSSEFSSIRKSGLEDGGKEIRRLERVVREAAMQARSAYLPDIHPIAGVDSFVKRYPQCGVCTVGGSASLESLRPMVIGPEGGFSPSELELFPRKFGLNDNILRSETAAVVVAGVLSMRRAGLLH